MKALIWIGALFIGGIISTLLGYTIGFKLGPIIVLIMIIVAKKLCDMWDERKQKKNSERLPEPNQNSDLDTITETVVTMETSSPIVKEDKQILSTASIPENVISEDPIDNNQNSDLITVFENSVAQKVNEPTFVEEDPITPTPSMSSIDLKKEPVKPAQNIDLKATFENAYSEEYAKASKDPNETDSPIIQNNKASKKWIAATICLLVMVLVLSGLNIYQLTKGKELTKKITDLNATIKNKNDLIADRYLDIYDLRSQNQTLRSINSTIINAATNGKLGYASNSFRASESIIVVGKNEKNRKFTLTANWANGGTVSVRYNSWSPSAYVDFDKNSWTTSTKMTIDPRKTGITVVTFSNSVNSQTFNVIIIVE